MDICIPLDDRRCLVGRHRRATFQINRETLGYTGRYQTQEKQSIGDGESPSGVKMIKRFDIGVLEATERLPPHLARDEEICDDHGVGSID